MIPTLNSRLLAALTLAAALLSPLIPKAGAQGTTFTYQGRLTDNNLAANGSYDLRFILRNADANSGQLGLVDNIGVTVVNGLFTVALNFGDNFPGADRWLEIQVRPGLTTGAFTPLSPRQKLTPVPFAIRAAIAGFAASAGSLAGNLSASQIAGGQLSDSLLSGNIPRLDLSPTFARTLGTSTTDQTVASLQGSNTGGSWFSLGNSSAGARTWSLISTGSGNGEGAGKLLFRDNNANAVRMTIDSAGNVGIGTTSPATPLDINLGSGGRFQIRNDGPTPAINLTGGGAPGILRLRNALEVMPNDAGTAAGKLDVRNTSGNATITLDGQSGNISAANMPGVDFDQFAHPTPGLGAAVQHSGTNVSFDIQQISLDIPSDGFVFLHGMVNYYWDPNFNSTLLLNFNNVTADQYILRSRTGSTRGYDITHLTWVLPVQRGPLTLKMNGSFDNGTLDIYSRHLSATFIPRQL